MMLSTFWLAFGFVLTVNGHPLTAVMLTLPWFVHRRWERKNAHQ